jgi:hypothetical protein
LSHIYSIINISGNEEYENNGNWDEDEDDYGIDGDWDDIYENNRDWDDSDNYQALTTPQSVYDG